MAFNLGSAGGPSPRVRGSHTSCPRNPIRDGSIPACAGKPTCSARPQPSRGVHPRVCGEAAIHGGSQSVSPGPSPRVRGSRRHGHQVRGVGGSIPACAGKPPRASRHGAGAGVHPRVCGEAGRPGAAGHADEGPSPRVRGSHPLLQDEPGGGGSIPACAGKPCRCSRPRRRTGVHPRVCGEAELRHPVAQHLQGPSPRVRGSPAERAEVDRGRGSIPACAGKPSARRSTRWLTGVHPRVCGEARPPGPAVRLSPGPSPRVRGSRGREPGPLLCRGSIPACAGKPPSSSIRSWRSRVHPRVCGEARLQLAQKEDAEGPSPRVRGSRCRGAGSNSSRGSIPACAGKPTA